VLHSSGRENKILRAKGDLLSSDICTGTVMVSSRKILKPDVPPKRHNTAPGFLGRLLQLLPFSPAQGSLFVRKHVSEQSPAAELKIVRRNGA
jgi:hypothetical protein